MKKILVAQQLFCPASASGPTTEFNILSNNLSDDFEIVPVIYKDIHKGFDFNAIRFYKEQFKTIKPDIVIVRGASIDAYYAVLGAKKAKCKCIITGIHGLYSDSTSYKGIKKIISKYFIEKSIIRKSSYFYTVSKRCYLTHKWMQKLQKKYYGNIHNPFLFVPEETLENKRKKLRQNFGISFEIPVGLFVGRITKDKGVIELSKAIASIGKTIDFYFVFVGNGDSEVECKIILKDLIENGKVIFMGAQKEVIDYYAASDFFVFPSKHENHPFSILEACSYGNYCLATDVGDVFETIIEGLNGEKILSCNQKDIEASIRELLKSKKYKNNFLNDWLELKKEELSLDTFISKTEEMYIKCYEETK